MTYMCFFLLLLTAEKFGLHDGQKHNIRRMLDTQLAVICSWTRRKRNVSSGSFLFYEKIEGGFCK